MSKLLWLQFVNNNFLRVDKIKIPSAATFRTTEAKPTMSPTKNVTFEELKMLKDRKDTLLIDVREPSELKETGVIPGSINIPLGQLEHTFKNLSADEFKKRFGREKPDPAFPLIFSCKMGTRSAKALELAKKLGYINLKNFSGGWNEWHHKMKA